MKYDVVISISGTQTPPGEAPETVELTTDGTLEQVGEGYRVCYEESELTGMSGTTTTFHIKPGQVVLERTGVVQSRMEFADGQVHESLYRVEEGALLLRVCARRLESSLSSEGGTLDLGYTIEIEDVPMGTIDYHIAVRRPVRPGAAN